LTKASTRKNERNKCIVGSTSKVNLRDTRCSWGQGDLSLLFFPHLDDFLNLVHNFRKYPWSMFINSQVVDHVLFPAEHKINSKITQKSWQILGWFLLKNLPIPAYSIYRTCGKFNTPIKRRFLARIAHAKPDKIAENGYKMCTYKSLQKFSKNRNDLKTFSLNHL